MPDCWAQSVKSIPAAVCSLSHKARNAWSGAPASWAQLHLVTFAVTSLASSFTLTAIFFAVVLIFWPTFLAPAAISFTSSLTFVFATSASALTVCVAVCANTLAANKDATRTTINLLIWGSLWSVENVRWFLCSLNVLPFHLFTSNQNTHPIVGF